MKNRIYVTLTVICASFLLSCSPTASDRIDVDPVAFAALPNWEKEHVIQGTITLGMSPEAVKLAWGNPQIVTPGESNDRYTQRWTYRTFRPVPYPRYGLGGYYGRYYPGYYSPIHYPDYYPVDTGYVLFQDNKVIAWEGRN